ncbi:MAG: hypothetical protein AB8G15_05075 [Saprospiraceae bacterium]
MTLPKNKNLRILTTNETDYYWKVEDDTRDFKGLLVTVGKVAKPDQRFVFLFRFDYAQIKNAPPTSKLSSTGVTPKLIKAAIDFAQENYNWGENLTCSFRFEKGIFCLADESGKLK